MTQARRQIRRTVAVALSAVALVAAAAVSSATASPMDGGGRALSASTRFAQRRPDVDATKQVAKLISHGDRADAKRLARMLATPQADWFAGGTPAQVRRQVRSVTRRAAALRTVPVLVIYNVPGRDCSQYSAGGAATDAQYRDWVDGFVAGLGQAHAVVIVEPDGLANLPSDCGSAYPGQDIDALTASRIADVSYAAHRAEAGDRNSLVYLDAGNSAWHSVGDMAKRLYQAGVGDVQGFDLNVSNYQYAANSDYYGTWLSECLAYATPVNSAHDAVAAGDYTNCGNQYWNGGPANNWQGVAMNPYGVWSETASDPALNTSGVDSHYAAELGSVTPTAHFVVDTSRDGAGPNDMQAYSAAPYNQPTDVISKLAAGNWCNPPGAAVGPRPQAHPEPGAFPMLDAYLWVKTVGESDGQCNIAGGARAWDYSAYNPWGWDATQQQQNDPLWGMADPAAGAWFDQQALQLARSMG